MEQYFFDGKDESFEEIPPNPLDQSIAEEFAKQVDAFYSLPRERRIRNEIVFSPSRVSSCARELYYENTNAPMDEEKLTPWKERLSRNGTGIHDITQADYFKMEERLKKAGLPVKFRFLDAEFNGEKVYMVNGVRVKLRGRSDGKIGVLDDEGNVIDTLLYEKKTKDKATNLKKITKEGRPQIQHIEQATAYFLIWGIRKVLFEYEGLQKPPWNKDEEKDMAHFYVEIDPNDAKQLLVRLSKIVEQIEDGRLPEPELSKCSFCAFKGQCHKDGGYNND